MNWKNQLNKKEIRHLRDSGIKTKYQLDKQLKFLKKCEAESPELPEPCWECKQIFIKLGMWDQVE